MKITVLAGGVGGARYLLGVRHWLQDSDGGDPAAQLTAIVNTADDLWLAGLRITPDLDTITYALAGVNDTTRGWGRAGDSEVVNGELAAWGVAWPWFTLGDLDIAASVARTAWLRDGVPLAEVVARLAARWDVGARLLPATGDEAETIVHLAQPTDDGRTELHFQEWWVRYRAALPAASFEVRGAAEARPSAGVLEAIAEADVVLLAPSNPVVSIGPILAIPGIREALRDTPAPVIGASPIIAGSVVRGMADACLTAIGVETSADAVARLHGSRTTGGLLDGWLVDTADADVVEGLVADGIPTRAVPLWMTDPATTARMVDAAISLAG
ncbi:2-phospho-L-lactate transferase [Pseudolysinimonas yzui]|uniref:2-phospho-L-lactate transferase n=1 Tax=Pseudolysinimonas yzui TaxID=2708254 RepID=A0A8J3LZN9_9MICO|nr:2-phospho-L-lactate transferase [Pseudolysinimonas yzui]GHF05856.1 2-phospho-L-lactate transferase [Pseudolysinimonas yzui]